MARVKICQTQATHSGRSLDITDSGGNPDRSIRKTAGTRAFFAAGFLAAAFFLVEAGLLIGASLGTAFFATAFLAGFTARFPVGVAMIHVYQTLLIRT